MLNRLSAFDAVRYNTNNRLYASGEEKKLVKRFSKQNFLQKYLPLIPHVLYSESRPIIKVYSL